MKQFFKFTFLFIAITIVVSCNNEQEPIQLKMDASSINLDEINSISEAIEAGIDIQVYLNSLPKKGNTISENILQRPNNSNLQFFFSQEDFPCAEGMPTENFDNINNSNSCLSDYLDENTDSEIISPGDILPGISFESPFDHYCSLYLRYDFNHNHVNYNVLVDNYGNDLIINFTEGGVLSVGFNVFTLYYDDNITIEVYGKDGFLGATTVHAEYYLEPPYLGLIADEPIIKLVLRSSYGYGYAGVDNITFGNCNDFDGDGCLNDEDMHPNSDLSETIVIDGCDTGVTNSFLNCGTTMMDEINDLIAEISEQAQIPRSRYRKPYRAQSQFMMGMYYLLAGWQSRGYITRYDNSAIMKCVYGSNIDFENNMEG